MIRPYMGITNFFVKSLGEFRERVNDAFDETIPSDSLIPVSEMHKRGKKGIVTEDLLPETLSKLSEIWEKPKGI